jgi:hypothetical protein
MGVAASIERRLKTECEGPLPKFMVVRERDRLGKIWANEIAMKSGARARNRKSGGTSKVAGRGAGRRARGGAKKKSTKAKPTTISPEERAFAAVRKEYQLALDIARKMGTDPWKRHRSPYGGSLSPNDEWERLKTGRLASPLMLSEDEVHSLCQKFSTKRKSVKKRRRGSPKKGARRGAETGAGAGAAAVNGALKTRAIASGAERDRLVLSMSEIPAATTASDICIASNVCVLDGETANSSMEPAVVAEHLVVAPLTPPLDDICWTPAMRAALVALCAPRCALSAECIERWGPCWLRVLCIPDCGISRAFACHDFPRLLELDLSGNPLGHADEDGQGDASLTAALSTAPRLRALRLSRCALRHIPFAAQVAVTKATPRPTELARLDLSNNAIANVAEIGTLGQFSRLESLDMRGNPCRESKGRDTSISSTSVSVQTIPSTPSEGAKECSVQKGQGSPSLATHAAETTPPRTTSYGAAIDTLRRRLSALHVVDGSACGVIALRGPIVDVSRAFQHEMVQSAADDGASCSCVEGNPCVSRYSCKHWDRRFEVARAARMAKHGGKDPLEH